MGSRRLFVGNLHKDTQRSDLESALTSAGAGIGAERVQSIEIRQKNDATFAFVDLNCGDEVAFNKCMTALNQTTVKGQVLKVQRAKEDFMARLKKEQEGKVAQPLQHYNSVRPQDNWRRERPPDNFDFEIVPVSKAQTKSEVSTHTAVTLKSGKKRGAALQKKSESEDSSSEEEAEKGGIPKFRGIGSYPGLLQSSVVPVAVEPPKPTPMTAHDRISEKMLAIAGGQQIRPSAPIRPALQSRPAPLSGRYQLSQQQQSRQFPQIPGPKSLSTMPTLPTVPFAEARTPAPAPAPMMVGGLKLNPNKKARSDNLRVQSLEAHHQLKANRSNLIRNALSNNALHRIDSTTESETPSTAKKPKVDSSAKAKGKTANNEFLFGNEEDEDPDEDYSIKVKPHYEGSAGQKMLELNANFAWDKRFQIDERFADEKERAAAAAIKSGDQNAEELEKDNQLDILGQILGKPIEKQQAKSKNLSQGKKKFGEDFGPLMVRYDPTREDHKIYRIDAPLPVETDKKDEKSAKLKEKVKQKGKDTAAVAVVEPQPPQSQEKPTFKVSANLKNLFNEGSFSVLSTFGGKRTATESENQEEKTAKTNGNASAAAKDKIDKDSSIRSFWNKNPFKYDSSDDEEEEKEKVDKVVNGEAEPTAKLKKKSKSATEKPRNYFKEDLFKRDRFFFEPEDERLKNVFVEFLAGEEDLEQVKKKFNEVGRSELKTIAKSKRKNSKRKSEKRTKIMRLARRKKRREAVQKAKLKNDCNK